MSNDTEWRIRALTAEHLLEHERAEIERLLDYAAELEEKLGELEQETASMSGRFLVIGGGSPTPVPEWVMEAIKLLDDSMETQRRAEAGRFRSKYPDPKKAKKGTAAPPAKNRHHAQFTRETWRK